MRLLFATGNAHKAEEVRALLHGTGVHVETLADHPELPEPPETGDTFEANALEKARFVHALTGRPVLADDSGLEVDALGGAPGVRSRRFSQEGTHEANNALLLARLSGRRDRAARFRCVLALVTDAGEATVDGTCAGRIAEAARGTHGFGYDPLFLPDDLDGLTLAEVPLATKNTLSHRARAFARLPGLLRQVGLLDQA